MRPGVREHWGEELGRYFTMRDSLVGLVIVMDARHPLKDSDWLMLEACVERGLPVLALLTKADKLGRNDQQAALRTVRTQLAEAGATAAVRLFSSTKPPDLDGLRAELARWLFDGTPPA